MIDPSASYVANKQHKHKASLGLSTDLTSTNAKKQRLKLQDLLIFTDEKNSVSIKHWLAKIDGKMTVNKNLMNTPKKRIIYVINRMNGTAFSHLEPRAWKNATKPWKDLDEMFTYLKRVFGNSNRQKNAKNDFWALRQDGKDFATFWAEF